MQTSDEVANMIKIYLHMHTLHEIEFQKHRWEQYKQNYDAKGPAQKRKGIW